jgi:hypothetical protein
MKSVLSAEVDLLFLIDKLTNGFLDMFDVLLKLTCE